MKKNTPAGNPTQGTSFELEVALRLGDAIALDSGLQEKYFSQLASGQNLLWHGSPWDTNEVFIPVNTQGQFAATVSKNASRLMTVFNTFTPSINTG